MGSALDTVFDEAVQQAAVDPDVRGPGQVPGADVALLTYSIRAATRAVRTQDTAPLHLAADALALAQPVSDHRELLRRIAVVADAAPRVGTSLDAVAEAMARRWQPSRIARMAAFSRTHPGTTKALTDMGWSTTSEAPFRYIDDLVASYDPRDLAERLRRAGAPAVVVSQVRDGKHV